MASPNPIPPNPTTPTTYILPAAFASLHELGISSLSDKRVPQIDPHLLAPGAFPSPDNKPVGGLRWLGGHGLEASDILWSKEFGTGVWLRAAG